MENAGADEIFVVIVGDCGECDKNVPAPSINDGYHLKINMEPVDVEHPEISSDFDAYYQKGLKKYRTHHKMLKQCKRKSLVKVLQSQLPEAERNESVLVQILSNIMTETKPPPPPRDHFVMNGVMFQCSECDALADSVPAAGRHYQRRHGPRYLECFACGADFRSTTSLYKHEKRCFAPESTVVLKARALSLGRRGRHRPFLQNNENSTCTQKENAATQAQAAWCCGECPARFRSRTALVSHGWLHRGLRPHRCRDCGAAYTSKSALARHCKQHGDARFQCDHCQRLFKVKAALVAHLDTHSPLKKHKCDECEKRYAQRAALVLHVDRVHRRLPAPFACAICNKRYPRMSLLKGHMRREHDMLLMTRKMFFKTLPKLTDEQLHKAKFMFESNANEHVVAKRHTKSSHEPESPEEMIEYFDSLQDDRESYK